MVHCLDGEWTETVYDNLLQGIKLKNKLRKASFTSHELDWTELKTHSSHVYTSGSIHIARTEVRELCDLVRGV